MIRLAHFLYRMAGWIMVFAVGTIVFEITRAM